MGNQMGFEKIRAGMSGVGNFGAARRSIMREAGLFDIVYANDINEDALKKCNEEEGSVSISDYSEMVKKEDIDAVFISTGAKFHEKQIILALNENKHVFVEKPLCSNEAGVYKILEAQKKSGCNVFVGHKDHMTDPFCMKITDLLKSNEIGKIVSFEYTTCHNGGLLIKEGDWRGDKENNPGGMLFQCGVHAFHELIYLFGKIKKIGCFMRYDIHTTQTADSAVCIIEFENGITGTLNTYHVCSYRHTFNIFGDKKNIYRNERYFDEGTSVLVQTANLTNEKSPMVPVELQGYRDDTAILKTFYENIKSGKTDCSSLDNAVGAVLAVFAAERSSKTGEFVIL